MSSDTQIAGALVLIFITMTAAVVVGLVLREVVCWYFKLNQIAKDLRIIAEYVQRQP